MTSWNMPPGVSVRDIPGYDMPDPWPAHRCWECGGWLAEKPAAVRDEEHWEPCDGVGCDGWALCEQSVPHEPHDVLVYVATIETRNCRKCGAKQEWVA
jgi:hypothetical protein